MDKKIGKRDQFVNNIIEFAVLRANRYGFHLLEIIRYGINLLESAIKAHISQTHNMITNVVLVLTLLVHVFAVDAKGVKYNLQNMQQQKIDHAQIGISFMLQLIIDGDDLASHPEGIMSNDSFMANLYGTHESSSYFNGKQTKTTIFTYIITPQQKGTIELGPIVVLYKDGTKLSTNPIKIEVKDISEPEYRANTPYILDLRPNSKRAYVGQKITMWLRFCYREKFNNLAVSNSVISGAHVTYPEQKWDDATIKLAGQDYPCKQLCFQMYPQRAGTLVVPSFEASFTPEKAEQQSVYNPFNFAHFFSAKSLQSHPCAVEVEPLPASTEYPGVTAIGAFDRITFSLQQSTGKVGEGLVAKMTVEGEGNLLIVKAPALIIPEGLQAYEGNSSIEHLSESIDRKTFEWIIQADAPGTYQLPPQRFAYFDLATKSYKRLQSEPACLVIDAAISQPLLDDAQEDAVEVVSQDSGAVQPVAHDTIQLMRSSGSALLGLGSLQSSQALSALIWCLIGLFVLLAAVLIIWSRIKESFFILSLTYRWQFWKAVRHQNIHELYHLFEQLSARYGFALQGSRLRDSFRALNVSGDPQRNAELNDEAFDRWKNFIGLLLEFNFTQKKISSDEALAFNLAKKWFPIILSCCKYISKKTT